MSRTHALAGGVKMGWRGFLAALSASRFKFAGQSSARWQTDGLRMTVRARYCQYGQANWVAHNAKRGEIASAYFYKHIEHAEGAILSGTVDPTGLCRSFTIES